MPKFIVKYYESFPRKMEVEAEDEKAAQEKVQEEWEARKGRSRSSMFFTGVCEKEKYKPDKGELLYDAILKGRIQVDYTGRDYPSVLSCRNSWVWQTYYPTYTKTWEPGAPVCRISANDLAAAGLTADEVWEEQYKNTRQADEKLALLARAARGD